MRKNPLELLLVTLVIGIFGHFLRWLQIVNAFDKETGLLNPGGFTTPALVVYTILAVIAFAVVSILWRKGRTYESEASGALRANNICRIVAAFCGAVIVFAGVWLMFTTGGAKYPGFRRVFAAAAIFGGAALPFILSDREGKLISGVCDLSAVAAVLFGCVFLVYSYKIHAESPVVWSYAPEILAVAALTFALYRICAYHYGKGKNAGKELLPVLLAAFLCIVSLADERETALQLIIGACAVMMLNIAWVLQSNSRDKKTENEEETA